MPFFALCMCVCVGVFVSKGMHPLKFSLFGISDSRFLTHFPSGHRLDLFLPHGGPTSTLPQQKRWEQEECVFSSRLALHAFQIGNMIPLCHLTQKRSLWVSSEVGRAEVETSDCVLRFQAPPARCDRRGPGAGAVTEVWLNPIRPCPHASMPRLPLEHALLWKTMNTSPGMHLCCWLCVDGEDGCACGHTRHSRSAIKPNWRWGIKPRCAEWYLGSWEWDGETERFGLVGMCWHWEDEDRGRILVHLWSNQQVVFDFRVFFFWLNVYRTSLVNVCDPCSVLPPTHCHIIIVHVHCGDPECHIGMLSPHVFRFSISQTKALQIQSR